MLGAVGGQGGTKVGQRETLQHLGGWAQEGDWSVVTALICWLACLWDGDDECLLPDVGDLGFAD